jgi:2,3-bisphosphoglycerate-independent phosphoglycerate mutase
MKKPLLLCILDGFGIAEDSAYNAISAAKTPYFDFLYQHYPHSTLQTSGLAVGLPEGQMGNSEVGHMNIGSGRVVMQDLPRIDAAIANGDFMHNKILSSFINKLPHQSSALHIMGLLSDGGIHSHRNHIVAAVNYAISQNVPVWLHLFLDGRDTPPKQAIEHWHWLQNALPLSGWQLATLSGRYYAMDRDKRWDRVAKAYNAILNGKGDLFVENSIDNFLNSHYAKGVYDEFIPPTIMPSYQGMAPLDGLWMVNFRSDRVRELLGSMILPEWPYFERQSGRHMGPVLAMTSYSEELDPYCDIIFKPQSLVNGLGELIAGQGLRQLRVAETEKYPHVTFFFNGGREQAFLGESRILIPSPHVATYDLAPEMSAFQVTETLIHNIKEGLYDVLIVNYANGDMVGHTGDFLASVKAVETLDQALSQLIPVLLEQGGCALITADHGNVELMFDETTGQAHTAHTTFPVPLFFISNDKNMYNLSNGSLSDIAPTILELLHIPQPIEMSGVSLLRKKH